MALPEMGSGMLFGTSISLPSTFSRNFSTAGGAGVVCAPGFILIFFSGGYLSRLCQFGFLCPGSLGNRPFGNEFIFELADKALHRPGTSFAKSTNRSTTGDIV